MKHRWFVVLGVSALGVMTACSSTNSSSSTTTASTAAATTTAKPSGSSSTSTEKPTTGSTADGSKTSTTMSQAEFNKFAAAMLGATPEQATCLFDAAKTNPGLALMFDQNKTSGTNPTFEQAQQILTGFNGCTGSQQATAKLLGPLLNISLNESAATCMTNVIGQLSPDDFAYLMAQMTSSISAAGMSQINSCTGTTTTSAPA